ncbi:helix-turn-helix domain-containing protein [Larkinella soli]|uniref:helix-turn-helix domain-containing protein n=1 Tax=Larkinella soli TaxID=1770527 RepID=UPI000FFC6248|nr:AraC family transcriptional regulator [Larkinella soli]
MHYQKFYPASHLKPFVECYFVWESGASLIQPVSVESPPTGYGSMVFNYGDRYRLRTQKHEDLIAPAVFLSGQATSNYQLHLQGHIGMIGIVFRAAGLSSLFGLPMYEFTDERIDLTAVLGSEVRTLHERLSEPNEPTGRVRLLEEYLSRRLSRTQAVIDRTDYVADLIVEHRGNVNINALMDELYVCRRQFERKFLHKVGVSPKYYARIRRVGFVCAQLAGNRWNVKDWHEFIYRAGYYDQSHFIREFSAFTGRSPSQYVRNNAELAHFLKS